MCVSLMMTPWHSSAGSQKAEDAGVLPTPSPIYPSIKFQIFNADYVFLGQGAGTPSNSSIKVQAQTFFISSLGAGFLQPAIKASFGPLAVDATIPPDLLLSGRKILAVLLVRQVRSSYPFVKILFHMAKDDAHCVTAYAFWETKEVRGACLVSPGGFCVAQLKPEPSWFSSGSRSGSSSREAEKTEAMKALRGNLVEVYFQSRRDQTGQCAPQDSLQRVGVGRGRDSGGSGTPLRRIGSVSLIKTQSGNPTFLRLRLGGAVMIQTSSKPLKSQDVGTFYIFLAKIVCGVPFLALKLDCITSATKCTNSEALKLNHAISSHTSSYLPFHVRNRGLLEILQLDFVPKDVSEQIESQAISWRLELPGNVKDVGLMRIFTAPRDFIGLAPLVMTTDILNTAVLTGKMVSVPVKTLAVEANDTVTDVTNFTNCKSAEMDVLQVSERCNYVFVNGKESKGKSKVMINFTYGFLSAQLEMSVWMPRLPLLIDIADPELSQIKGWRVPVTTGNKRSTWDSEEDEDMRKGRGCMLQYQLSPVRVLTSFVAQPDSEVLPGPLTGEEPVEYFLGSDWQVDVTDLVRYALKVADPEVARVQDGVVLQGRAVGTTVVQVLSPVTSLVLAERSIRVVDDKVSVTELGVQLVSGLSLSLQLSPGSNRAIVATATTREIITELKQEAVVSCWVQFSDGAVAPLELFDRGVYSLTVSTNDERVATVRRTPLSTFVVAQGEGEGRGRQVKVELRICEECQKSKRKSKLASGRVVAGGASKNVEAVGGAVLTESTITTTLPNRYAQTPAVWVGKTKPTGGAASSVIDTATPTAIKNLWSNAQLNTAKPTVSFVSKGDGKKKKYGNMLDNSNSSSNNATPEGDKPENESPKTKAPKVIESDLIRTFKALSDLEIGMYSLIGVSCLAIVAFLLNCASYKLCFRKQKTPIQTAPAPTADPKDHKHDWVWMGSNSHSTPPPGAPAAPAQAATLKREPHCPLESHHSIDTMVPGGLQGSLPTVSAPAVPERTATLGRCRSSSQQHQFQVKGIDPMANRSATLLARPHRSEPLHSPTSKRNQVQFTTFTTLDIKHLAALKKNGVDLNWANQKTQQQSLPQPQAPLPDMPWPVVTPLGEPQ
uniref:Transmembrane protein 132D-like n=1 Tax=Poecilia latipinna TaxID=48699 RepID=A0A3B3VA65_9TELE